MMDLNNINKLESLKKSMIVTKTNDNREDKTNYVHSNLDKTEVSMKTNYKDNARRPKRREIWYVDLGNPRGSLQKGIRPCLIDSNDINNKYSNIVNVFPLTSQMTKAKIPVHIEVDGYGLKEKSIILIEQGTPIDIRFQLLQYIGTVDDLVMKKVDIARDIQHGDLQEKTPLERLPKYIRTKIDDILDNILTYEKALSIASNQSLIENLLEQREAFLWSLQKFCEDNELNYRDFYRKYEVKKKVFAM